jgi:hypothetical protein
MIAEITLFSLSTTLREIALFYMPLFTPEDL